MRGPKKEFLSSDRDDFWTALGAALAKGTPARGLTLARDRPSYAGAEWADIHSTLPGERFARMREEWVSNGAWGYSNIKVG